MTQMQIVRVKFSKRTEQPDGVPITKERRSWRDCTVKVGLLFKKCVIYRYQLNSHVFRKDNYVLNNNHIDIFDNFGKEGDGPCMSCQKQIKMCMVGNAPPSKAQFYFCIACLSYQIFFEHVTDAKANIIPHLMNGRINI